MGDVAPNPPLNTATFDNSSDALLTLAQTFAFDGQGYKVRISNANGFYTKETNNFTMRVSLDCTPNLETNTSFQTSYGIITMSLATLNNSALSVEYPIVSTYNNCTLVEYKLIHQDPNNTIVRIDDASTGVMLSNGVDGIEDNLIMRAVF